jgi:hypothetical protein
MSVFPLVLSAALSVPGAFTAANGLHVQPTGDASFAVPYAGLSAPTDFWCAAGDYALHVLGQRGDTLIYRTSVLPRRSGEGMAFSLDAAASAGKSGLVLLGSDGAGVTAGLAVSFCEKMAD